MAQAKKAPHVDGGENQTGETKPRKAREAKVKHAEGSPHDVLHKFIDRLTPTQADYLHRHIVKKALKDEHADPASFEGELYTGIKEKL